MLTKSGWGAAFGGVTCVVAAVGLGYTPLAILGVGGLAACLVSLLWLVYRPSYSVDRALLPARVTVGEPASARLMVRNDARRRSLPMFAVERIGEGGREVVLPSLPVGHSFTFEHPLPTGHRAVVAVGPLEIRRADPFGFVRADQHFGDNSLLYVHPRVHMLVGMPASMERSFDGPTADAAAGSQVFHTLREYVAGDDRRLIHWKSSARTGTLMVREHVDTTLPDLVVVLDAHDGRQSVDTFEESVEIVASMGMSCLRLQYPVTVRTSGGALIETRGLSDPQVMFLDALAGLHRNDQADLVGLLQSLRRSRGGLALVVVGTGFDAATCSALAELKAVFRTVTSVDLADEPASGLPGGVTAYRCRSAIDFAEQWNGRGMR